MTVALDASNRDLLDAMLQCAVRRIVVRTQSLRRAFSNGLGTSIAKKRSGMTFVEPWATHLGAATLRLAPWHGIEQRTKGPVD